VSTILTEVGAFFPPSCILPTHDSITFLVLFIPLTQIHYNNPSGVAGKIDDSVIRFGYTKTLRPNDAASLVLGDGLVTNPSTIEPGRNSMFSFLCPSSCTNQFSSSLNVFGNFLHAVGFFFFFFFFLHPNA
jgi:hypothetical protein